MKSLHALIVDDNTQELETMGMILEMDNFRVSTAPDGIQALAALEGAEENPPAVDFLVMDLDMANLSGIGLLAEMRKRGHSLPVLVVTGFASKGTVVELLRQGVSDFLDKPIHMEEFRSRVHGLADAALRRRKAGDGFQSQPLPVSGVRASAVLDLGRLGIPYAMRRRIGSAAENNLVLAARKPHGFDLLIADVEGDDAESFYVSILVKSFFDRWRFDPIDGLEFLATLNGVVLGGSLVRKSVRAMLLRVHTRERRVEAYPAGYPAACFTGVGGEVSRTLAWEGESLGVGGNPGSTLIEFAYAQGDRIFLAPALSGDADHGSDASLAEARARESLSDLRERNLDALADGIWMRLSERRDGGTAAPSQAFLLGLELP